MSTAMSLAGDATSSDAAPAASIVIPAHDEERVIGRLLAALTGVGSDRFEVIVVCNGCTDATVEIARAVGSDIVVIEQSEPSKHSALRAGNRAASNFPRLLVDADVELDAAGVCALVAALARDPTLRAVGPARHVPTACSSWPVRAYYDVWEQLPAVRSGLFGRGVIAVSRAGFERLGDIPEMMGDDLVISEAFAPSERAIIDAAVVTVYPPRTIGDLHRRRVRAATGNRQADVAGLRHPTTRLSPRDLIGVMRSRPRLIPSMLVFIGISVTGRIAARRAIRAGDFTTWARDESSRIAIE